MDRQELRTPPRPEQQTKGRRHRAPGTRRQRKTNLLTGWVIHRTFRAGEQFQSASGQKIIAIAGAKITTEKAAFYNWVTVDLFAPPVGLPEHLYNVDGRKTAPRHQNHIRPVYSVREHA